MRFADRERFRRRMLTVSGAALALVLPMAGEGVVSAQSAVPALPAAAVPVQPPRYSPDKDPYFAQPYIDVDEWRASPVRHRYVHGGFKGTETRFSFYFPPKSQYRGRFFQTITPVPDDETINQKALPGENDQIGAAFAGGAYFVATNSGGKLDLGKVGGKKFDPALSAHKANAAAAAYSRTIAATMYGGKRPFGYAYGGSGGGYRTIGSIENTTGVWDGAVPFVIGSTMAIPNMFTVRLRVLRVIGDKLDQVAAAAQPGGSGDIYAGLTPLQQDVLREATAMGFRPETWYAWRTMGAHGFAALYPGIVAADPTYFTDFWTKPGYLGHDHPEQFAGARMQHETTVAGLMTAAQAARSRINIDASSEQQRGGVDTAFLIPEGADGERVAAIRLGSEAPAIPFQGGDVFVLSGAATGKRLSIARIVGDVAVFGVVDADIAKTLQPGDRIRLDNSNWLAMETYHWHQVPGPDFKVWDQFRNADGTPKYPQRNMLLGPIFVPMSGRKESGDFEGKMIVLESLWDREALPWQADWYRNRVVANLGAKTDQHFRLWYTDHAVHGYVAGSPDENPSQIVSYVPVLNQALRDLAEWVEQGVAPPDSTNYSVAGGQVAVPPTASARLGIQPVVSLQVGGRDRAAIRVGETLTFTGSIAAPPGAGFVTGAQWDFDGTGKSYVEQPVAGRQARVNVTTRHRFDRPGTYFATLRATTQREGDRQTPYTQIPNLARVRVVVR